MAYLCPLFCSIKKLSPKEIFPPLASVDQITIRGGYVGASADILDKMAVKEIEDKLLNLSPKKNSRYIAPIQNGSFIVQELRVLLWLEEFLPRCVYL